MRCAELTGTFYVNSGGEYMIELANGEVVTPNKFEELAGKKTARNWQQSIRVVGESHRTIQLCCYSMVQSQSTACLSACLVASLVR